MGVNTWCTMAPYRHYHWMSGNIHATRKISLVQTNHSVGVHLCGLHARHLGSCVNIAQRAGYGTSLGWAKKTLFVLTAPRMVIGALSRIGNVAGFAFYYFNERDLCEHSVHEGLTCVLADYRGRGIGTAMRRHALDHFARCGIRAITSRVSADNLASLRSNFNLGFQVIESFNDTTQGQLQYYMRCPTRRT